MKFDLDDVDQVYWSWCRWCRWCIWCRWNSCIWCRWCRWCKESKTSYYLKEVDMLIWQEKPMAGAFAKNAFTTGLTFPMKNDCQSQSIANSSRKCEASEDWRNMAQQISVSTELLFLTRSWSSTTVRCPIVLTCPKESQFKRLLLVANFLLGSLPNSFEGQTEYYQWPQGQLALDNLLGPVWLPVPFTGGQI